MYGFHMFDIMEYTLEEAIRQGVYQAEVFVSDDDYFGNLIDDSHVSLGAHRHWCGAGIRVLIKKPEGNSIGFSYTSSFTKESLQKATKMAIKAAKVARIDPFFQSFPQDELFQEFQEISDQKLRNITPEQTASLAERLANVTDENKKVSTILGLLRMGFSRRWIINSLGIKGSYESSLFLTEIHAVIKSVSPRVIATEIIVDKNYNEDLTINCAKKAVKWAPTKINPKNMSHSGKMTLIIEPLALTRILLPSMLQWLRADRVLETKSYLGSSNNICAEHLTIIDDPALIGGSGSKPFDDEGVSGKRTVLVENGIPKDLMHNHYTAMKNNMESNGHAFRGDYRPENFAFMLEPRIAPTNLLIQSKNRISRDQMIQEVKEGLLIKDFIPGTVKTGTGLVFPFLDAVYIKNGEIKNAINSGIFRHSLKEFFFQIKALCDEDVKNVIIPGYMVAAPCIKTGSVLVDEVSVL